MVKYPPPGGETGRRLAQRSLRPQRSRKRRHRHIKTSCAPFSLPNHSLLQHDNLRSSLTPRRHREPQKSRTKVHFSTKYTLSTRNQRMPLILLIYSQIHVIKFPPMAKLFHILIKTNKQTTISLFALTIG